MSQDLKTIYQKEIRAKLQKDLGLDNIESVPKLEKITLNTSSSDFKSDKDFLEKTKSWLTDISGQVPVETKARLAIAGFNIRENDIVGLKVVLRGQRMYDFFSKLVNIVLPRLKDFQGVSRDKVDSQGNYHLGFTEQLVFPEVEYDKIGRIQGLEVNITTSTKDKNQTLALLEALGVPFTKEETAKK